MTNQAQVRDVYLRVIDATIESVRDDLNERSASESTLESLELLKSRWVARLTQTHDFTDDPALVDKPTTSSARGGKKAALAKAKKKGAPTAPSSSPTANPPSRNGVISVASLTNATDEAVSPPLPPVPRVVGKPEPLADDEVVEVKVEPPPAKRARTETPPAKKEEEDDGRIENAGEDLDSDDSDVPDNDSDEEAENLVLAQHDKVKKGNKWKIILREGIVSVRGREYLFNKATCDLDF